MNHPSLNPRLARLEVLVGEWELTTSTEGRTMSTSVATFEWLGDRGFLVYRVDPPSHIVPEWAGLAPEWVDAVIGVDDYSDMFTMLYADSRGVGRTYQMTLAGRRWTMSSRPGEDFHQRFEGTLNDEGSVIDARWEASRDGRSWTRDFNVTWRRLPSTRKKT